MADHHLAGPVFIGAGAVSGTAAAGDLGWRDFFVDPVMQGLIVLALRDNRDLGNTAPNVATSYARHEVQHAALFPTINAVATADFARQAPVEEGDIDGPAPQCQ